MRSFIVVVVAALCVALVSSYPAAEGGNLRSEALDRLVMAEADNETALRSKRTIGILREIFPELSQMVEQKVNAIIAEIIRVVGPSLVRNFLSSNQPAGTGNQPSDGSTVTVASPFDDDDDAGIQSTSSNGSKVSISLPTFPSEEDDETESLNASTTEPSNPETTTNDRNDAANTVA